MSSPRPTLMTPYMRVAMEFLSDGQWRRRDEVIEEMAKAITPGQAIRHQETARLRQKEARRKQGLPVTATDDRRTDRSSFYLVTTGRRGVAVKALNSARRIEQEVRDGETWVRLRDPQPRS